VIGWQALRIRLAEVAWAEQKAAEASQLLDQVAKSAATSAATRRRAEQLRAEWGLAQAAAD
jgi:hypothetical protein